MNHKHGRLPEELRPSSFIPHAQFGDTHVLCNVTLEEVLSFSLKQGKLPENVILRQTDVISVGVTKACCS